MNENQETVLPADGSETASEEITNAQPVEPAETLLPRTDALTKDGIIENLKKLVTQETIPARQEIESLKHAYYKIRSAEIEAAQQKFIEDGNDVNSFEPTPDPSEDVLKIYLGEIKNKRAQQIAKEEKIKEENYQKKLVIIESIKSLSERTDDFNKLYKDFKDLQQQWSAIKDVPASKENDLWKSYQRYTEVFYDLIKINNEFRDYDFKKNLELKTAICEAVEKLTIDADAISAFHQLQNFHQQWREIGPVSREIREEIWERFKVASTTINKNYQAHFESLKGKESENLEQKTAIINALKSIDYDSLSSMKAWDEKSKEIIDLQATWKTVGFVPRKLNTQIFEEFRVLCDTFFNKKSEFFKGIKEDMDANLEKKKALCEKVNVLKESTDWKKTTDELVAIQKEWKTIGPVPRKYSDSLWKEFVAACDHFFEQKKKNNVSQKDEEIGNLKAKKEVTERIKTIDLTLATEQIIEEVKKLADEWHNIGFVPFKEKDKAYKEFHSAVDAHYDRLKIDRADRRFNTFKTNIEDISKSDNAKQLLRKEKDRLVHTYNKLKADLQTYENNMNFLSISSKGANSLLKDVNHKIEDLKNEIDLIEKKILSIEDRMNDIK